MKTLTRLTIVLFAVLALLVFAGRAGAQTTQPTGPRIRIAFDKQPIGNFDRIKGIGANTLHRYESGSSRNVTLQTWLAEADKRGLYSIIEGVEVEAQGLDFATLPAGVVAIGQPDEMDINRSASGDIVTYYSAADAPHPSVTGWTRPGLAIDRYARWKTKTPLPILANFAGPSINSGYYKPDMVYHQGYIAAADELSSDTYPANANGGPPYSTYWPANCTDKLKVASKGKPVGGYVECAFGGGSFKRGPTRAEQSTITWSLIGHGCRTLTYFPQRVNPPFSFWAMTAENEAGAKEDIAAILKYSDLICDGKLTVVQTPKAQTSNYTAPGGVLVWPETEAFMWSRDSGESLVVSVNYKAPTIPVVTYTPSPTTQPSPPDPIAQLRTDVEAARAQDRREIEAAKADVAKANAKADAADAKAAAANAVIDAMLKGAAGAKGN